MALRFGILGTGNIARQFAGSFRTSTRCVVSAVGSRERASAEAFVAGYAPAAEATSYEGVLASGEVDAVYVSFPNSMHREWTIRALRAGKHVLCEKPLGINAGEVEEMFAEARKAGRLLVEAFMYVSHPLTEAVLEAVRAGRLGRVRHVRTSFCYRTMKIAGNVRFDAALGGGALLDIGCYCVHFSRLIARAAMGADVEPEEVWAEGSFHEPSGVDDQVAGLLRFPSGLTATFNCGMAVQADNTATVSCEEGYLEIPVPWKPPAENARLVMARSVPPKQDSPPASMAATGASVRPPPPLREELLFQAGKDLYAMEADDFAAAVSGEMSPRVSQADSLGNARVLDRIAAMIARKKP